MIVATGCLDWRSCDPADVAPLVAREMAAWRTELDWDVQQSWAGLEPARAAGRLPGLVLPGEGRGARGWACYLVHRQTLQVAVLVADSEEATETLVTSVFASEEAAAATSIAICVRSAAPGLVPTLAARGMRVIRYRYLSRPLHARDVETPDGRVWRAGDEPLVAGLLAEAYRASSSVRAFAPHDTADEWLDYVGALTSGDGCGRLIPTASWVSPGGDGRTAPRLDSTILTTRLSDQTAHVAQLAVSPASRRSGRARGLVEAAGAEARRLGCTRLTLLVADDNSPARRLYEGMGFAETASFVVGLRRQPS